MTYTVQVFQPIRGTVLAKRDLVRFGIGEWYGRPLISLSLDERKQFAREQSMAKAERPQHICPFKLSKEGLCNKAGGVCSIQAYSRNSDGHVSIPSGAVGALRATCPNRFHEASIIYGWVAKDVLNCAAPKLVPEVGFLAADPRLDTAGGEDVGRIDMVLVGGDTLEEDDLSWCALEIQAVYFSGKSMSAEFAMLRDSNDIIPFPAAQRRPDYRSSGPKRLMPQLQIKVPTLRRWGKKMAVVVDEAFFESIGEMDHVEDISNADIAWFVVRFEHATGAGAAQLVCSKVRLTTLERSVEGLTGGSPVPKTTFEDRVRKKASQKAQLDLIVDDGSGSEAE